MADHFSILPWRIPWTEEPGGPWGLKELDTTVQITLMLLLLLLLSRFGRVRLCVTP